MPQYFGQLPTSDLPWSTPCGITSWTRHLRGVRFECGGPSFDLTVLAHDLVRVRFAPGGTFLPRRSWAVTCDDSEWPAVDFGFAERSEGFELTTEQLRIVVERATCRLSCFDPAGRTFACDADAGLGWRTGQIAAWKRIEADEYFYGFGERTGMLNKRSERLTNWATDALDYGSLTDNMYQAIPFFIALRPGLAYGVFLNSTFFSHFDLGAEKPGCWQMQTCAPELDYYLIYGPTPERILFRYTELTGRAPLPPLWALGYHQCRWSYDSEDKVYELARTFRSRRIPCDVIHLDIDYMRGYRVFTWSPSRFSDPKKLIGDLGSQGFRTVTIVDPGIKYEPEANYAVFDQGLAKNYFVRTAAGQLFHGYVWPDKAVFPDFLKPAVRRWWGDWHARLTEMGVAGIWNDMNEPTIDDRPFGDGGTKISFPSDAAAGDPAEQATWAEGHNLYGQQMVRACREGLDRLRPTERSFVLTRSGFAGIQRYGAVWMGDNQSQWEHLELSLPMLCNMGLSGVAFVGADIGGFARNATAELFARWMQVGMLYPLMRGHSALHTARHEPWVFGERVEAICRKYIELRYQLLPYLYTLFWRATTQGEPILRPLVYQYPDDERTYQLHDQVLLGPLLMAAPILRPGSDCRAVYLPAGLWYDWWTGERFEGPAHILAHAPLEHLPLYVPAGATLPMNPVRQHTGEPTDALIWRVWPGEGSWTLYEDDGNSFAYREGQWATTTCHVQQTAVQLTERQGNWQPPERQIRIELLGCGSRQFCDDGAARQLLFRESCN